MKSYLSTLSAAALCSAAVLAAPGVNAAPLHGTAILSPINDSDVRARISFANGENRRVKVIGSAIGMDPDATYVSLIYGAGSQPNGPTPCVGPLKIIGQWNVDRNDGSAVLEGEIDVWPVQIASVSVRRIDVTGVLPDGERGSIGQANLTLEACGAPRVTFRE